MANTIRSITRIQQVAQEVDPRGYFANREVDPIPTEVYRKRLEERNTDIPRDTQTHFYEQENDGETIRIREYDAFLDDYFAMYGIPHEIRKDITSRVIEERPVEPEPPRNPYVRWPRSNWEGGNPPRR